MPDATDYAAGRNPWDADKPFDYGNIWVSSGPIIRSMCRKVTGNEKMGWQQYVMEKYLHPALTRWTEYVSDAARDGAYPYLNTKPPEEYRCLILGSNEGAVERQLCEWGFVGEIVASDIAENALARARDQAQALGYHNIRHLKADLNTDRFDGRFDFIIAEGVLHHIAELESCLGMLREVLADDGVLIAPEFVGPFRFQMPPEQVAWINATLGILPQGLRRIAPPRDPRMPSAASYAAPPEAMIVSFDPSEATAGHLLKRLLPEMFDIVEATELGGTITTYLHELVDYPKTNEPSYADWMDIAITIEETLIRQGVLNSDYVFYVARRKAG